MRFMERGRSLQVGGLHSWSYIRATRPCGPCGTPTARCRRPGDARADARVLIATVVAVARRWCATSTPWPVRAPEILRHLLGINDVPSNPRVTDSMATRPLRARRASRGAAGPDDTPRLAVRRRDVVLRFFVSTRLFARSLCLGSVASWAPPASHIL